jgi:hypothetical protein
MLLDELEATLRSGFIARVELLPVTREPLDFIPMEALVLVQRDSPCTRLAIVSAGQWP